MSKNKNQNKNQTSYEEQNRQLVDALYEQKLVNGYYEVTKKA